MKEARSSAKNEIVYDRYYLWFFNASKKYCPLPLNSKNQKIKKNTLKSIKTKLIKFLKKLLPFTTRLIFLPPFATRSTIFSSPLFCDSIYFGFFSSIIVNSINWNTNFLPLAATSLTSTPFSWAMKPKSRSILTLENFCTIKKIKGKKWSNEHDVIMLCYQVQQK